MPALLRPTRGKAPEHPPAKGPAGRKRRRRKPHLPTSRQEVFIRLCAAHGNRTRAYVEAGYRSSHPGQDAYKLASLPYISERIRQAIEAQVGGKPGLTARLAQQADTNIADFEPWLKGRKSLGRLAEDGVNVACVESVAIHKGKDGSTRRIKLHSSQEAIWKLVRMGGYGQGGTDPDAPKPAQVSVVVDMGRMLAGRMREAAGRPPAPGLPADERFAGRTASPLLTERSKFKVQSSKPEEKR